MTPAALADLVCCIARDVLADRGLDATVLPPAVTVQRPRNPEHGDYTTNLAPRTAKSADLAVTHPLTGHGADLGLIRTIGEFGQVVAAGAAPREPHRVARNLGQLASAYYTFCDTCWVLLVGVRAPERM